MRGIWLAPPAVFAVLVVAACGGSPAATSAPATATTRTLTETRVATPSPVSTQAAVTFTQSIAVGKALFPNVNGIYTECIKSGYDTSSCPLDTRLKAQIATYAANYQQRCPQGCAGALLFLRQQCGGFSTENVSTPQNESIAIVTLKGNSCMGNFSEIMYVQVVVENGQPLADDVMCNVGDPKYGMYNTMAGAMGGNQCAPFPSG